MTRVEFEWDEGNNTKNYSKHGVSCLEAESVFQDDYRLDFTDPFHSISEKRYLTLGRSNRPRILIIAWTLRGIKVRIISARPASKKERAVYETQKKIK
ncbi:MAG: BrnT family toxin [Oligoflexia bacterium]|nr:BrnT family toxin [Oligoflexia bacterium]